MKSILPVVAILLLPACMGGGGGMAASAAPPPLPAATPVDPSFTSMLNQVRADNSVAPLNQDARLMRAAQVHSDDQYIMRKMTHDGSDGSTVGVRVKAQGYDWTMVGENVASGFQDERSVMDGWIGSPDHQANKIHPLYEDFGIAKTGSGSHRYWTLVFGRTSPLPPGSR